MTQDIDDLIAAKPVLGHPSPVTWDQWADKAAAALRAQRDEIARLQKLEKQCWTSPEQWMAWCDIRILERAERAEAERDAAIRDAQRYRWLRDDSDPKRPIWITSTFRLGEKSPVLEMAAADAAIDAAIAKEKG